MQTTNPSSTTESRTNKEQQWQIVLHNDDVNTFDHVIKSLIHICNHTPEQATQCAYIVHYKGKIDVKRGDYFKLEPTVYALWHEGLSVTLDVIY